MSAFSGAYPDATVTGCYFHLCQSVIRKVNDIELKTEYETNNEICIYVRCLRTLAFVPPVSRRRGGGVRTSCWVAANNRRSSWQADHILRTHLHSWPQTMRTYSDLWSSHIPRRNLDSARCRVRRHSSQHQQRRGVAPRAAVSVPVSPSNHVEFHDWDSAGHSAPKSTISAGYDWSNAPVGKKISFTEQSCCTSSRSLWSRWSTCLYLRSIAYLSHS